MNLVFIYALNDPLTGRTRYVGKTADLKARLSVHFADAKRQRNHRSNWLTQLRLAGLRPAVEILDCVPANEWAFWEREWIKLFRALQFKLVNQTDGGEGAPGAKLSPQHRAKISASHMGKTLAPEHNVALQRGRIGHKITPETRRKRSLAFSGPNNPNHGVPKTPEQKARLSKANMGKRQSPETKEKRAAANRGRIRTPEQRARISAGRIAANSRRHA